MQIKSLSSLLWILPFLSFILGYQLLNYFYTVNKIATPNLVGKTLSQAIKISSQHNLNLRILSEQIDPDLPEDMILMQKPNHQQMRPNQAIFVVISKKPAAKIVPNLCGCSESELAACLTKANLKTKSYYLPSPLPHGLCFGHTPSANHELAHQQLITYLSAGSSNLMIMPKLIDRPFTDVQAFLDQHNLKIKVKYLMHPHQASNYVIEQQPAAGTIVNLDKLTHVDLGVTTSDAEVASAIFKIS